MPSPSLKPFIPIIPVLIIIVLAIGAIFYFKPKLAVDQVSTESSKLENIPTNLGLNFEGQKITFNYLHELIINNQSKGISKEFNLNLNDLKEGKNNLEFKGIKTYGPIIAVSKNPKTIQITTDKTAPELNLVSQTPKFVQLEKEIKLKLKTEIGTKIILNDKELNKAENEETEITIPVIDGKNNNQITTKDSFGNTSKPIDIEFQALQREGWEKYQCKDVFLPINLNSVQRGFTDFGYYGSPSLGGKPFTKLSDAQSAYLKETQLGSCKPSDDKNINFSLSINPKGAKLDCFSCGSSPLPYIKFSSDTVAERSDRKKLIKSTDYTTKSGISGKLNEYIVSGLQVPGNYINPEFIKEFEFKKNNYIYIINMTKEETEELNARVVYQNIEKDFEDILNNFVFVSNS